MAGAGFRTWSPGETVTAANLQTYIQDQVNPVYAGTAARGSALGTAVSEGMSAYLKDYNTIEVYTGASWIGQNYRTVTAMTATAYTATLADAQTLIRASSTAAQTITVPDVFLVGQGFEITRMGAGTVSIAAGTGATTWVGAGTAGTAVAFKIDTQYSGAQVIKTASNEYTVIGKITA